MTLETEIKLRPESLGLIRGRLVEAGAKVLTERHFEDNLLLDDQAGGLRAAGRLLRLRKTSRGTWVTYKGTPAPASPYKEREEVETAVADFEAVVALFERLGFKVWARYQKYREEFELALAAPPGCSVHVALDDTPIGPYIEIEGPGDCIRAAATLLGFGEAEYIRESYYGLYMEHCRRHGLAPGQMVFESERLQV